jgi:hypothetical protein
MAVSARNVAPPPPTIEQIAAHIDHLWVALAADPGQRAMAVARLCMAAPELAPAARAGGQSVGVRFAIPDSAKAL